MKNYRGCCGGSISPYDDRSVLFSGENTPPYLIMFSMQSSTGFINCPANHPEGVSQDVLTSVFRDQEEGKPPPAGLYPELFVSEGASRFRLLLLLSTSSSCMFCDD